MGSFYPRELKNSEGRSSWRVHSTRRDRPMDPIPTGPSALVSDRRRTKIRHMETTRGSGTIEATSAMPARLVMTSGACVGFGMVLVSMSFVSTAIERTGLNWQTVALIVLVTFCGLGLIGMIVHGLAARRGYQQGALDHERGLTGETADRDTRSEPIDTRHREGDDEEQDATTGPGKQRPLASPR
jgi:hypothetical protein